MVRYAKYSYDKHYSLHIRISRLRSRLIFYTVLCSGYKIPRVPSGVRGIIVRLLFGVGAEVVDGFFDGAVHKEKTACLVVG